MTNIRLPSVTGLRERLASEDDKHKPVPSWVGSLMVDSVDGLRGSTVGWSRYERVVAAVASPNSAISNLNRKVSWDGDWLGSDEQKTAIAKRASLIASSFCLDAFCYSLQGIKLEGWARDNLKALTTQPKKSIEWALTSMNLDEASVEAGEGILGMIPEILAITRTGFIENRGIFGSYHGDKRAGIMSILASNDLKNMAASLIVNSEGRFSKKRVSRRKQEAFHVAKRAAQCYVWVGRKLVQCARTNPGDSMTRPGHRAKELELQLFKNFTLPATHRLLAEMVLCSRFNTDSNSFGTFTEADQDLMMMLARRIPDINTEILKLTDLRLALSPVHGI